MATTREIKVVQVEEYAAEVGGEEVVVRRFDRVDAETGEVIGCVPENLRAVRVTPSFLPDRYGRVQANDYHD